MNTIISSFFATLITIPILVYIFVFIISKQFMRNHRKAVQLAIDSSTIFIIFSVHFLVLTIWHRSFLWAIFIFLLCSAIIFVFINWKIKGEIIFGRFMKGFWRFCFLVFLFAYFGLTIYGLIQRVNSNL